MLFNLCLALGFSHPRHLVAALSTDDFLDWLTFWEIDPPDNTRADLRSYAHAIISTGAPSKLKPIYPYIEGIDDEEISDADLESIIAAQHNLDPDG